MALALRRGDTPRPRKVLSFSEDKFLTEKEKQLEGDLANKEIAQGVSWEPKDKQPLEKKLAEIKAIKSKYGAVRLEGKERVQAEKEITLIEAQLSQKWGGKIPSYAEYWMRPREGIRYNMLVDTLVRLNRDGVYQNLVSRWKSLRRQLEPDDRHIDSTLHLHKT